MGRLLPERLRAERLLPERFREKVLGIAFKFLGGLEALRSPREALMIFVTSVIIWLFETGKYWFVMHAFDFEVSFFALMLMNGIGLAESVSGLYKLLNQLKKVIK